MICDANALGEGTTCDQGMTSDYTKREGKGKVFLPDCSLDADGYAGRMSGSRGGGSKRSPFQSQNAVTETEKWEPVMD